MNALVRGTLAKRMIVQNRFYGLEAHKKLGMYMY